MITDEVLESHGFRPASHRKWWRHADTVTYMGRCDTGDWDFESTWVRVNHIRTAEQLAACINLKESIDAELRASG